MKATEKMKRVLCVALAGGLALVCLAGCGEKKETGGSAGISAESSLETSTAAQESAVSSEPQGMEASTGEMVFSGPEDRNCTSYVIPEGVTKIDISAFAFCSSLTSIEIPDGVTQIGCRVFSFTALTEIEIPVSVTQVGEGVFSGCEELKSIKIPEGMDISNWGLSDDVQVIYY